MSHRKTHTHWQVAQKAAARAKTCQRVWLPKRTDEKKARACNIV